MRILHVITRLILGGAQQNTVLSCQAQVAAGHEVHLAFGPIHGPEGSLLAEARATGATLHEVRSLVRSLHPLHDVHCYFALRRLIRKIQPTLVHSHSSKAGIVVRAAAWAERVPVVLHTVHGLPFHTQQSAVAHRLYVELERWAARRCHHLIAITPAMVDAFVKEKIADPSRFTVIPSGIDVEAFSPRPQQRDPVRQRLGIPAGALVVGHVGRLDPLKGHADLLDILPDLRQGGRDVWLLFVGDGYHRAALEQHPNMALHKTVVTGLVPLTDVPNYLAAMDVLALPSYQEGQSRTLCEGSLAGLPLVAYDVGGIPAVCVHEQTGLLAPVGDRDALQQNITTLLTDPAYRAELAAAGRVHVQANFSAERMNRALLALYEALV